MPSQVKTLLTFNTVNKKRITLQTVSNANSGYYRVIVTEDGAREMDPNQYTSIASACEDMLHELGSTNKEYKEALVRMVLACEVKRK